MIMTITTNSRTIRRRNLDPTNSTHRAFEQTFSEAKSEKFSTLSPPEKIKDIVGREGKIKLKI